MKQFILILVIVILHSFANTKNHEDNCVMIYKTTNYDIYSIYHGKQGDDTILFIGKQNILKNCPTLKYINKERLSNIKNLVLSSGDTIIFNFKAKDLNNNEVAVIGSGRPGQKNRVYFNTYSQFPYYLNDYSSFVGCE